MKKETLAKANRLEEDIQQMECALSYYKQGQWCYWDYANDSADSFHFEFCKNWSRSKADVQDLPKWLTKPLMDVVERELNRCKKEFEMLHDDSINNHEEFVPIDKYNEEEHPATQKEKHGTIWKLFWSLVLAIILIVASSLCVVFTCYAIGDSFGMQTLVCGVLFGTVWLTSYILIDKDK